MVTVIKDHFGQKLRKNQNDFADMSTCQMRWSQNRLEFGFINIGQTVTGSSLTGTRTATEISIPVLDEGRKAGQY